MDVTTKMNVWDNILYHFSFVSDVPCWQTWSRMMEKTRLLWANNQTTVGKVPPVHRITAHNVEEQDE